MKSKEYCKLKRAFELMNKTANLEARSQQKATKAELSDDEKAWNMDYEAKLREFHRTGDWSIWR